MQEQEEDQPFGWWLRSTRKKLGFRQQQLAEMLGYESAATIGRWEKGQNKPKLRQDYQQLIKALGVSVSQTRIDRWMQDLHPSPLSTNPSNLPDPRNPYKGLRPFTQKDTADFFGHKAMLEKAVEMVRPWIAEQPVHSSTLLLTILGASGSGKSSLVLAGLLPQMQQGVLPGSDSWLYLDPIVPGKHPIEALLSTLKPHFPDTSFKAMREDLKDEIAHGLHLLLMRLAKPPGNKVVLFIDQGEELFTPTETEDEQRQFLRLLLHACSEPRGPLIALLSLRADFYDRLMNYPELYRLIEKQHLSLLAMEPDDLRLVIEQPVALPDVQVTFEGDLVHRLLADIQGEVGGLPLLQFTLDQLFQSRDGRKLTLDAYHELGGVKGALSKQAEKTYEALPSNEHRRLSQALFMRLIDPGATERDTTRRRAALIEFVPTDQTQARLMGETIDAFIAVRLLTTNEIAGTSIIEVSHEAVIREWKRLAEWMHEARQDIPLQQAISKDAADWERRNKPGARLYRGSQLKEARAWAKRNIPSQAEAAFLHAGARQRVHNRVSILVFVLLFLSSIGAGALLYNPFSHPNPTLVTTPQDTGSVGSLRWAVVSAPSSATITFAPSLEATTIVLTGDLVIPNTKRLTLKSSGPAKQTISVTKSTMLVDDEGSLTLLNLRLLGGPDNPNSLLTNHGTLTLMNSTVSGNTALGHDRIHDGISIGGGINNDGVMTLINSTISGNTSENYGGGGGIYNTSMGTMTLTNSTVSGNDGGGIDNDGIMTLTNSTISGNNGGGINNDGIMTLTNSTVSGNISWDGGGGINNTSTVTMTLINSTVSGNTSSDGGGGGIYNQGPMALTNSTISDNTSENYGGGGIYNQGTMALTNSIISGNSAHDVPPVYLARGGGGIYNTIIGTMTLTNSTVSGNTSQDSGGGALNDGGTMTLTFCTFFGNQAASGGGLVTRTNNLGRGSFIIDHTTIQNSLIAGNTASTHPDIAGNPISKGYNLIQNASGIHLQSTDHIGISSLALNIDPTLRFNGSKITETHALWPGSPAIDVIPLPSCHIAVNGVLITTDQRGNPRPDGLENACDVGAFEASP